MRLLVTGGAGYVGSIVAQHLVARGDHVTSSTRSLRGHRAAVPAGAELVVGDLLNPDDVAAAVAGTDGVLHFAALALVAESVAHPERYYRGNVTGTLNLLDAMRDAEVPRLVFSSTAATYGEPQSDPITEDEPTAPVNAYGNSKLAVDRMIGDECRAHGLAAVSLRYFNVAGASGPLGEDHDPETHLIPLVLQAAAGKRDHVSIFGDRLPDRGRHRGPRLHPRRRPRARPRARAREAGLRAPRHLQPRHGHGLLRPPGHRRGQAASPGASSRCARSPAAPATRRAWWRRTRKAREGLGWVPEKSLDEIVADAWAWHSAHPAGYDDCGGPGERRACREAG